MSETTAAPGAADQPRAKTEEGGTQAKEKAQEVGAQARDRVRDEVDRRSTQAGQQAGTAAQALRDASQRLRQDGNEPVANGIEQVAQRVESAGGWLRDADGDRILRDVEDFARRQPWLVAAGGLALGFAASRFLKASSSRRYQAGQEGGGDGGYGRAYTSPYDTRTAYGAGTRYGTTEVPVVGAYDPEPVQGEPLRDAYDQRRV
jgi:hypothetical protein